jgi:lysophospholipase L1-like esterase
LAAVYTIDAIHLSAEGYAVRAAVLAPVMKAD